MVFTANKSSKNKIRIIKKDNDISYYDANDLTYSDKWNSSWWGNYLLCILDATTGKILFDDGVLRKFLNNGK